MFIFSNSIFFDGSTRLRTKAMRLLARYSSRMVVLVSVWGRASTRDPPPLDLPPLPDPDPKQGTAGPGRAGTAGPGHLFFLVLIYLTRAAKKREDPEIRAIHREANFFRGFF